MHTAFRYIPDGIPAHPENYDRVCVHGVRVNYTDSDGVEHCAVDDVHPQFFSVYGGLKDSPQVECFGDFTTKADAYTFALDLAAEYRWPIWDCEKANNLTPRAFTF